MNPTSTPTVGPRIHAVVEEVFGPVHAPSGSARRHLLLARSAIAYVGLLATLVQVVVWLMVAALTAHLDTPWWLWTTAPAVAAVVVLTAADRWHTWWSSASATTTTSPTRTRI